jgi:hypothetical protein
MPIPSRLNRTSPSKLPLLLLLILSGGLLPAGTPSKPPRRTVVTGAWGGEHVILEASKAGAEVEFDCAHGQILQAIVLDPHGNFDVAGTFTPEHGGPVRRNENTPPAPARYSGRVIVDTMRLEVTIGKDDVRTFALTRGFHPNLTKCR